MGNIFNGLGDIPKDKINSKGEVLKAYEECHAKLLRDYNDEIIEITEKLSELRKERLEFYESTLLQIKMRMEEEGVSEEAITEWLERLINNMENSFRVSENIIKSFWVDLKEEFSAKLASEIERM